MALLRVDPATGKTTPLIVEKDPAWVNLEQDVPRWLPDGSRFLWASDNVVGPRLELHDKDGSLLRVLVPSKLGFQGLVDVDGKAEQIVIRASSDPTQSHLFRVPLDGAPTQLTGGNGLYDAVFSKDHSVYVRRVTETGTMPKTTVHRADGTVIGELPSVAQEPPFVPKVEWLKVGEQGFHAAIVRPHGFDPKKKYPVIVDVYGGPGHNHVRPP